MMNNSRGLSIACKTKGCEGRAGVLVGYCPRCRGRMVQRKNKAVVEVGPGRKRLTEEEVALLWRRRAAFRSTSEIARELEVSRATVQRHVRLGRPK